MVKAVPEQNITSAQFKYSWVQLRPNPITAALTGSIVCEQKSWLQRIMVEELHVASKALGDGWR
jgi:hypothetical protein